MANLNNLARFRGAPPIQQFLMMSDQAVIDAFNRAGALQMFTKSPEGKAEVLKALISKEVVADGKCTEER